MVTRFKLELTNKTPANWAVWKILEPEFKRSADKLGVSEFDFEYDDENFVKVFSVEYESDDELCKLMTEAAVCAGKHGLEVELISREILECPSQNLIHQHKLKYKTPPF